jgi:D-alanyl-lipoteichoic acid acyltransferase DltB (MBOAT superfamily)
LAAKCPLFTGGTMKPEIMGNFLISLDIMWKGMTGLFLVCGFVMLVLMLIVRIVRKKRKKPGT